MQISDWINAALCILSFFLSATSVVIVIITLRQNSRMLENSTRPYIAISYETMTILPGEVSRYIVVKNYGQSGAVIHNMTCDGVKDDRFLKQLEKIRNTSLSPSQRRLYYLGGQENLDDTQTATFRYDYSGNGKHYTETITVHLISGAQVKRKGNDESVAFTLQEIAERLI